METYVIFRRNGWRTADEIEEAARRSTVAGEHMGEDVRWIRSYVIAETDGSLAPSASFRRPARRRSDGTPTPPHCPSTRSSRPRTRSSCVQTRWTPA
jgi:hypothetical protein